MTDLCINIIGLQLDRRVQLVDPVLVSYNFSSVLAGQPLCSRPCGSLSSIQTVRVL